MARQKHLTHAPIVEAIIDFRVVLPTEFDPITFSKLSDELSQKYPKQQPLRLISGKFGVEAGKPVNEAEDKGIQGYLFRSDDEKNVAQFRSDGFTYNRLKPYTSWEDVIGEARSLWGVYKNFTHPVSIGRIAVRYINQLFLPINIGDFLTSPPRVPRGIPSTVSSFLNRLVVEDAERGITANVTQAMEKGVGPDCVSILLDIDVYRQKNVPQDESQIWAVFAQMRELKNSIFFSSIKAKTAEKYK